jgi:hypothetical protein
MPGYANPGYGRGFGGGGRGWRHAGSFGGGGRGWRNRFFATGLPRWARSDEVVPMPDGEATWLKQRADWLQEQLDAINRRIEEIEKNTE